MPYRNPDAIFHINMIAIFLVLGVILLIVPVACTVVALYSKTQQKKRAEIIKNATSTSTTVQQGPNGRTVFEAKKINTSPPRSNSRRQSPPRSPILPMTQQQANKVARPKSMKAAWKRLSRPFSMMPAQVQDDEIELRRQMPSFSRSNEHVSTEYEGPVSPLTPCSAHMGSSSSWKTYDNLESRTPVSPLSVTNLPASSSVTGTIIRGYQPQNPYASQYLQGVEPIADRMHDIHLTPPSRPKPVKKNSRTKLDLGTSLGFVPAQTIAGNRYAPSDIKTSCVDANVEKVNEIRLAKPPKAKVHKK